MSRRSSLFRTVILSLVLTISALSAYRLGENRLRTGEQSWSLVLDLGGIDRPADAAALSAELRAHPNTGGLEQARPGRRAIEQLVARFRLPPTAADVRADETIAV
jgi:hypothetical protein